MGFYNKRRALGLHLILFLGLGLQGFWCTVPLATSASASSRASANQWTLDRTAPPEVVNPFFDASENILEEPGLQRITPDVLVSSAGKGGVWRRLAILVALGISVAVALQFHRQAFNSFLKRHHESEAPSDEEPQSNERLEKVRDWVNSASMITASIKTPEVAELMGRLKENVDNADRIHRKGGAEEEIEASLDAAIDCIQSLHREIIQYADAIAEDNKVISLQPLLDANNTDPAAEIASLEAFHETAVGPFLQSLQSVHTLSENLYARANTIHGELGSPEMFAQEDGGEVLHSTAVKVSSLLSTLDAQQYVERLAKGLVSGSLNGLKVAMLAEREAKRFRLQLTLDVVRMHLQQSKGALKNISNSAKGEASVEGKKAVLGSIEEEVHGISGKISQLLVTAKKLRTSESLRNIFAVCASSQQTENEVSADLERILGTLTEFEPKAEDLDKVSKQVMAEVVEKYRQFFAGKHEVTQRACYEVEDRVGSVIIKGKLPSATIMQRLHGRIAQNILDRVNQAMEKSEEEMSYAENAIRELRTMDKLSAGVQVLEGLKVVANSIINLKEESLIQLLNVHLLNILHQDVAHILKEEATIESDPEFPHVDRQKMQELQNNFKAAKDKAQSAGTLQEMAVAAAAMRSYHDRIEELLYEHRRNA